MDVLTCDLKSMKRIWFLYDMLLKLILPLKMSNKLKFLLT